MRGRARLPDAGLGGLCVALRRVPGGGRLPRVQGDLGRDDLPRAALVIGREFHDVLQVAVMVRDHGIAAYGPGTAAETRRLAAAVRILDVHTVFGGFRTDFVGPDGKDGLARSVGFGPRLARHDVAGVALDGGQAHRDHGPVDRFAVLIVDARRHIDGRKSAHRSPRLRGHAVSRRPSARLASRMRACATPCS